jgi:hypothetical protein
MNKKKHKKILSHIERKGLVDEKIAIPSIFITFPKPSFIVYGDDRGLLGIKHIFVYVNTQGSKMKTRDKLSSQPQHLLILRSSCYHSLPSTLLRKHLMLIISSKI